ncbi:MAG TPA: WG repeat-containing protein [Cytophagales bacterium]|nr:WG repeat-containing protein [Cytophagales bacterium]
MKDLNCLLLKVILVFTTLLLLIPFNGYSDKLKSALKQLNKGNFEKSKKLLDKSLSKEEVNPGAKYIYSLYYTRIDNSAYNIDSGYNYILTSIEEFRTLDDKNKKKLAKLYINDSTLARQKARIEEIAFANTTEISTEEGYNKFIDQFATSSQIPLAIKRRDEIAFNKALSLNTSKSYFEFLQKYPQSELSEQARENYELKLFQEATGTGTLNGYIEFLRKNPESPYRMRAEEKVFKISTILNTKEKYTEFIQRFSSSAFVRSAFTYLLFHYLEENNLDEFIRKYPNNPYSSKAAQLLTRQDSIYYAFYDNNKFGFINELGGQLSKARFNGVPDDYLCNGIGDEYILFTKDDKLGAIDKTGASILPPEFDEIEKIGIATLAATKDTLIYLYLMDGTKLLKEGFQDVQKLNPAFIKVKSKGLWGIRGLNGAEVLAASYDNISLYIKDFFVLKRKGKYAITRSKDLVDIAETGQINLDFKYDYYEEIGEDFLKVGIDNKQGVIDSTLQTVLPINYSAITKTDNAWLTKKNGGIEIFNEKGSLLSGIVYDKVVRGNGIFAVKHQKKWGMISDAGLALLPLEYDSIVIIGDKISLIYKDNKTSGFFNSEKTIDLPEFEKIEVQTTVLNPQDSAKEQYLILVGKDGKLAIVDERGKSILKTRYDKIKVITNNLFVVEQRGKAGIVDSVGKVQLPLKYDAIGNYKNGYVSVLKSSKFGIFNARNNIFIQPKFDALIKVFNPERKIFLALDKGAYAFLDEKGKPISEHKFKEASHWKGDTVLVKEGNEFYLYSIESKEKISDVFQSIKFINDSETERLGVIYNDAKYGVISNKNGFIVPLKYNDVTNLGTSERPFFMAEHQVEEADLYVVLYINYKGDLVMSQAYKSGEYEKLLCQD